MEDIQKPAPLFKRLSTLFLLYTVHGMPYGFFAVALPLFLRDAGWSRTAIGFLGGLGLPWFFKFLWAPLVDRFFWPGFGKRKSWIVPCTTILTFLVFLLSLSEPTKMSSEIWLLATVFGINLFAATQDIAVDGLAVDILSPRDRGPGNAIQVVGYKAGMLFSGGFLLAFTDQLGWRGICWAMTLLSVVILFFAIRFSESEVTGDGSPEHTDLALILRSLMDMARRRGILMAIVLIATYKMGETLIDAMYKIFLRDMGLSIATIGIMNGGWGLAFSLIGSLTGGFIARDVNRINVLFGVGVARFFPLAAIAFLPYLASAASLWVLYPVTLAEHFAGGMLTTVMFAFMMDLCDRRVGATHYTTLAAIEVAGKFSVGLFAGLLADQIGYGPLFTIGAGLSALWVVLALKARDIAIQNSTAIAH